MQFDKATLMLYNIHGFKIKKDFLNTLNQITRDKCVSTPF